MSFSGSLLPLLVDCAAPANPATWLAKDAKNAAMNVGNAVHRLAEWYIDDQPTDVGKACEMEGVGADDVGRVDRLWMVLLDWLTVSTCGGSLPEVAFAYNPSTGAARLLGQSIAREYEKHGMRADEIGMTADIVYVGSGRVIVDDLKTGNSPAESYRWQLRALGLAAARLYKVDFATIRVVKVSEVEVDDSWTEDLDAEDLDDVAAEVLRVWREAPTAKPRAGNHCAAHYCRARSKCDAFRAWRAT